MAINQRYLVLFALPVLFLMATTVEALRAAPPRNVEFVGVVTLGGKPVRHAKVELRLGSCFGDVISSAWTNQKGEYLLFERQIYSPAYLSVADGWYGESTHLYEGHCLFAGVNFPYARSGQTISYPVTLKWKKPPSPEQQQCLQQGGMWGALTAKAMGCNLTFKDAGKTCNDGEQCMGKVCFNYWQRARIRGRLNGQCATDSFQVLHNRNSGVGGILNRISGKIVKGKVLPLE